MADQGSSAADDAADAVQVETAGVQYCSRCRASHPLDRFARRRNGAYQKTCRQYERESDVMPSSPSTTARHFHIVALETYLTGIPAAFAVPAPHSCSVTAYERSAPADVAARLRDADMAVVTVLPLGADVLAPAVSPRLRCIAVMASGTDSIDLAACAARGIRVLNSPNCNTPTVAAHALALFFACRRRLRPAMGALVGDGWPREGTLVGRVRQPGAEGAAAAAAAAKSADYPPGFPRGLHDETAVVVGYGAVGRQVAALFRALGMAVEVAGRKGDASVPDDRVPFEDALRRASVLVVCCPRTPATLGLLAAPEFAALGQRDCVLVNVSRGGVVDEAALVAALRAGRLGGAGVDVFAQEPASAATSPLVAAAAADEGLNLVLTPHTAWVAEDTYRNYHQAVRDNVWDFVAGTPRPERVRA